MTRCPPHWWLLAPPSPDGPETGTCKYCGLTRTFDPEAGVAGRFSRKFFEKRKPAKATS